MKIPLTNIHKSRVLEQISRNLIGLQSDMRSNAMKHKAMLASGKASAFNVAQYISDCADRYLQRLQWVIDLRANATKRAMLVEALTNAGWSESDITDVVTPLRSAAIALRDAPRNDATEINAACDAMLSAVDAPESLWPE